MSELIQTDNVDSQTFTRLIEKQNIPVCPILGVNIAAISMEWLLEFLETNIRNPKGNLLRGDYICVSNVHTTVTAYENPEYCKIQNEALMAIPDGGPLSSLGKQRGYRTMSRTAGPSLMGEIFRESNHNDYRHYFYGTTPETLDKLYAELIDTYPNIKIAGMYSPPFRPMTVDEDVAMIKLINSTKPDIIWVGLGAPKQEKWMSEHQGKINGLMIGVGAGFDYYAGNINRAPKWMQKHNLEWFHRLIQDPKRLFKRYIITNTKFLWLTKVKEHNCMIT